MTHLITADMIIAAKPCKDWPDGRVREAVPEPVDFVDLMHDDRIPVADRIWGACKVGVIPDRELRLFACECAERAIEHERQAGHEPDPRSVAAIEVARRFAGLDGCAEELRKTYNMGTFIASDALDTGKPIFAKKSCALAAYVNSKIAAYTSANASVDAAAASAHCGDQIVARHEERDWQIARLYEIARGL